VGGGARIAGSADKDPSEIVIDEVAGQFVALWPVSFGAEFAGVGFLDLWPGIVTAFLAFRLFDIWKPGPVGWADRQEGALGVMADDLIAGWLAALVVAVFAVVAHLIADPVMSAEEVIAALGAGRWMLATAESCTGGMIAAAITDVPGSSAALDRGFVTYSNAAKVEMLGVAEATLNDHGAVSEQVAAEMAKGALRLSAAQIAISVTGIAGPGGSEFKPEGRVCFGVATADLIYTETVDFGARGRDAVRKAAWPMRWTCCSTRWSDLARGPGRTAVARPGRSSTFARASKARTIRCIASWKNSPPRPAEACS
jgi:nicotinamide-nucleotide amidase